MSFPLAQASQINLFTKGILLLGILCLIELVKIRQDDLIAHAII